MAALSAQDIIDRLDLQPHPEGGWYRETWRADGPGRAGGTSIHFLLTAGQRSHWHRVDATELWIFQGGSPLKLRTAKGDKGEAGIVDHVLGLDLAAGQVTQVALEPYEWQGAETLGDWTLVACVVVPGFEFSGFELAPPGWNPGA